MSAASVAHGCSSPDGRLDAAPNPVADGFEVESRELDSEKVDVAAVEVAGGADADSTWSMAKRDASVEAIVFPGHEVCSLIQACAVERRERQHRYVIAQICRPRTRSQELFRQINAILLHASSPAGSSAVDASP